MAQTPEHDRLSKNGLDWKRWGPYLSERQWGTVREDYSHDGNAQSCGTSGAERERVKVCLTQLSKSLGRPGAITSPCWKETRW